MATQNICFKLSSNFTDISNDRYIFNNNYDIINYGLYETSGNTINSTYTINNIPKNYPLGFYIDSCNNTSSNDISNLIKYTSLNSHNSKNKIIKIYVSKGNDISYNNGDYFRFFDESYNLINISTQFSTNQENSILTNSGDNFYFMKGVSYEFIAAFDFSSSFPFELSSNSSTLFTQTEINKFKLNMLDNSFIINISENANNNDNIIQYYDACNNDIYGDLEILVDNSGINYYYDSINFQIFEELSINQIFLSIKSYPNIDAEINEISNINLFNYNSQCKFIIKGNDEKEQLLSQENSECLTNFSEAKLMNDVNIYYQFNNKTHNNSILEKIPGDISLNNIKYGLYDGSYILFNIDASYAITIDNIDISNNIYINPNYYYTKKYNKTGGIIQNIRDSDASYKKYDFYYGSIQLIINNNNNILQQDYSFNYLILDLSNLDNNKYKVEKITNKLFYTTYCENNTDNFLDDLTNIFTTTNNGITYNNINFQLYNQKNILFKDTSNNDDENIYKLNVFEPYKLIKNNNNIQEFSAYDIYGHDLRNFVSFTMEYIINENYSDLSNIEKIKELTNNYTQNRFIVTYNLKYFDLNDITITRIVEINFGPIIEISNNEDIFKNKNSLTKKLDISTNELLSNNYNFYKNIDVYIKDTSGNKIFLPFNIILDGFRYKQESTYNNPIIENINNSNIKYEETRSILKINNFDHYISTNLKISREIDSNISIINLSEGQNKKPLILKNIDTSNILYSSISFYNNLINNNFVNFSYDTQNNNFIFFNASTKFNIYDISKNDNKYIINAIQEDDNKSLLINTKIEFIKESQNNPELFNIFIQDNNDSNNNITICGEFITTNFFYKNYIDVSYIGNYNLNVNILGLNETDYIYNTIKNSLFDTAYNKEKTYNIEIFDKTKPTLTFLNKSATSDHVTNPNIKNIYNYKHPYTSSFDLDTNKNDIFFKNISIEELSNKPIIKYIENSIYTPILSYEQLTLPSTITISGTTIDGSKNSNLYIRFFLIDLCGNITNNEDRITLDISFLNIPYLELLGNEASKVEVNFNDYIDDGFIIESSLNLVDSNSSIANLFNYDKNVVLFETTSGEITFNSSDYIIKRSTNLNLQEIGSYDISYIVNISGETESNFIIRKINVIKENKPYLYLYDLSNLSTLNNGIYAKAIDVSRGIFQEDLSNALFTNIYTSDSSYSELNVNNKSNFILDFSFTYLSNFEDLSKILNAYDLCDNYFADTSLNVKITINLSGQEIVFKEISNNVTTYLQNPINELVFNDVSYLNQDSSFNIVTKSILNAQPELNIFYFISDPCNNDFSFNRIINIVDIIPPTISFNVSNISNFIDNSFILNYSIDYKDFSYQAYNYDVNNAGFLNEISNILFGFTIQDNFSNSEHIKNNYVITISGEKIKTIEDISNTKLNIIKDKFKNIDNSFTIIYDFSDNQYNNTSISRNINIINTIEPSLNVVSNSNIFNLFTYTSYEGFINISFGDLSYNFLNDICLNHSRLNSSDISFELSYNLPESLITSISGLNSIKYDASALIYQFEKNSNVKEISNITFFNIAKNPNGFEISSNILKPLIEINIEPPIFYPATFDTIIHEAGEYLSDASLINGIYAYSIFDEFYYNSSNSLYSGISISYSETNYDVSIINNINSIFNQYEPTTSPENYTITYSATDQNNISNNKTRQLIVKDSKPPIFQGTSGIKTLDETNDIFIDENLTIRDIGSDLSSLIIEIKKINNITNTIDICNILYPLTSGKTYDYLGQVLSFIDLSNSNIEYLITYIAYDSHDNSGTFTRKIIINSTNNIIIIPKITIKEPNKTEIFNLIFDFSYNNSDLSLNFININSTKTIFYEATTQDIFQNTIDFSLDALYNNSNNGVNILNPVHNIISNKVDNYSVFFQAYKIDGANFYSNSININFNIIDTKPPQLEFQNNNYGPLVLPLLSQPMITELQNDLNYFNKYYNNELLFLKNNDGNIIFSINGININDITGEPAISLSNETLENNTQYNLIVTYKDLSNTSNDNFVDSSYILTASGNYEQNYEVTDNHGNKSIISRNIIIKRQPPFIKLNYLNNYTTKDKYNNIYKKQYHKIYDEYYKLDVYGYDYYDSSNLSITEPTITDKTIIDVNSSKNYNLVYSIKNSIDLSSSLIHNVEVVNIERFVSNIKIEDIIEKNKNKIKFGIYGNDISFIINVETSNNAIRLKSMTEIFNDSYNNVIKHDTFNEDNYDAIKIYSDLSFVHPSNNKIFYYGNVVLTINDNFNRATIKYLENTIEKELVDFILYNKDFEITNIDNIFGNQNIENIESYIVKTDYINNSNINIQDNSDNKVFKIKKFNNNNNNINNNDLRIFELSNNGFINKPNFYLSFGTYRFYQGHYSNFHNQIKFSFLPDGYHYNYNSLSGEIKNDLTLLSLENITNLNFNGKQDPSFNKYKYTKNINSKGLPGFKASFKNDISKNELNLNNYPYVEIIIDATTPNPLYYYSENYPNMGGKIEIKNNLTLLNKNNKVNLLLNGNILTIDNSNIDYSNNNFNSANFNDNSNNRIFLSQHFDLSSIITGKIESRNKSFIGITQQNINHNMIFTNDNKIIFKKYEDVSTNNSELSQYKDISNYNIVKDNSNNFLYDFSASKFNSQLLFFDFIIDTSLNIDNFINTSNINNSSYLLNINNLFFANNEINNYYNFFKENKIDNLTLTNDNFIHKINEIAYINTVNIKDGNNDYQYFEDNYLNSSKIYFNPIFDNKIVMNLQSYIDINKLDITNNSYKEYLINNIFNKNEIITNYTTDPSNLFFQEYVFSLYSDICGIFPLQTEISSVSLIFKDGTLELSDYLLDSSFSNDIIDKLFYDISDNDSSNNTINNRIFLTIKDIDNCNNLIFNGLTQQNIYHNMYLDDENKFIIHRYNPSSVNAFVNNKDADLLNNILELTNNNRYFLELSNNDPYNCFINSNNLYDRNIEKNDFFKSTIITSNTIDEYKSRISYNIIPELSNNHEYISNRSNFDIRPMSLNDICYNIYPYAYDLSLQKLHSHSYIINLRNHIDRNFYNTNQVKQKISFNIINYDKLYYVIKDISYDSLHDFSLFDLENKQNIIYKKDEITILKSLQREIFVLNLKMQYLNIIFQNAGFSTPIITKINEIYKNQLKNSLIYNNDYNNLVTLYEETNFINENYNLDIGTKSLNDLFSYAYFNSNILIEYYNTLLSEINFFYNNTTFIKNVYNNIRNFSAISQLNNEIKLINSNVNNLIITNTTTNTEKILTNNEFTNNLFGISYENFDALDDLIKSFLELREKYERINFELELRDDDNKFIDTDVLSSKPNLSYIDIYSNNDLSLCYNNLVNNYITLYKFLQFDICNSNLEMNFITGHNWKISDNSKNINPETSYGIDLSNIYNNRNLELDITQLYNDISYLLHNSYGSTDISFSDSSWNENHKSDFNKALKYIIHNEIPSLEIDNPFSFKEDYKIYIQIDNSFVHVNEDEDINIALNEFDTTINNYYNNNKANIKFFEDQKTFLENILDNYIDSINIYYDYIKKTVENTRINYIMAGDSLLVNSFKSNNILIKFDLYYNSYLYKNTYLDTFVLDMAIPDYTPPTIIFKTEIIDIQLANSNKNDVNIILEQLLKDISYIDINQLDISGNSYTENLEIDLSINNIEFKYLDNKNKNKNKNKNNDNLDISYGSNLNITDICNSAIIISIDISSLIHGYIEYTIKDYANNENKIIRHVNTITNFSEPQLFYPNNTRRIISPFSQEDNLFILEEDSLNNIISKAKNNIFILDIQDNSGLFYVKDDPMFDVLLDISVIYLDEKPNQIKYTITSVVGINNVTELLRNITITKEDLIVEKPIHCCYPNVYYYPVQHNYKLGSQASSSMRLAKIIINS